MQKEPVSRGKMRQNGVRLPLGDGLIGAAVKQNAVLPQRVHLYDGVPGGQSGVLADERDVHPALGEFPQEKGAVAADFSGVPDGQAGPGQGNTLVEALSASGGLHLQGRQRLARTDKVGHSIGAVDVERTEIEYLHADKPPCVADQGSCLVLSTGVW